MFTITVQPSGLQFQAEENELILDAGLRQGIALPYGCRGGGCSSCAATLMNGETQYLAGKPRGLSDEHVAQNKIFLCQSVALSDLELNSPQTSSDPEIETKLLPVRVDKMRKLSHDVMELTVKLPASERLRFRAGQYLDILLTGGKRRSFSIANSPLDEGYLELHIRQVPGGHFTGHVFEKMQEKALLRIEGPMGSFYIRESERPLILMGGGTGFAPLKGMIEQMRANGFERPVHLYWGVRSREDLYMDALVKDWDSRAEQLSYIPVLSEPKDEDNWQGRTGWVHDAVAQDFDDLSGYDVYMSGPPPMIESARPVFLAKGLLEENLYSDSFDFSSDTLKDIEENGQG